MGSLDNKGPGITIGVLQTLFFNSFTQTFGISITGLADQTFVGQALRFLGLWFWPNSAATLVRSDRVPSLRPCVLVGCIAHETDHDSNLVPNCPGRGPGSLGSDLGPSPSFTVQIVLKGSPTIANTGPTLCGVESTIRHRTARSARTSLAGSN